MFGNWIELQNTMGKDFGSMNMDELLKNIWNAEEMQTMGYNTATTGPDRAGAGGVNLQRQGSLTLPRTLSQKTVDEVWKDLSKEYNNGFGQPDLPQRQQTLGEMTLEDFLVKAGVVREETRLELGNKPNDTMLFSNLTNYQNTPAFGAIGFQQNTAVNDNGSNQITFQSTNLPLINNGVRSTQNQPQILFPKQGNLGYGGPNQLGSPVMNSVNLVSSDGLAKSNGGDISPDPNAFNGVLRGRRSGPIEKVVERRHTRMIKRQDQITIKLLETQIY